MHSVHQGKKKLPLSVPPNNKLTPLSNHAVCRQPHSALSAFRGMADRNWSHWLPLLSVKSSERGQGQSHSLALDQALTSALIARGLMWRHSEKRRSLNSKIGGSGLPCAMLLHRAGKDNMFINVIEKNYCNKKINH